jgi:two-component system, cell cycle sensor histidine kinase and response regulator CckA
LLGDIGMTVHESGFLGVPTILLVEDNELVLDVARSMLEINGYRVVSTFLPSTALNLVAQGDFLVDLLVTDVFMPQMNGPELYRRMQERRPELRVLYISGFSDEAINGVMEDQNADLLSKPFTSTALLGRIKKIFDGQGKPNPDKLDKCVNEIIFLPKSARNNF